MPKLEPIPLQIKGMIQDAPRDDMPRGSAWHIRDVLPSAQGANLRARGAWVYRSAPFTGSETPLAGIFANFEEADKLLIVGTDGKLYECDPAGDSSSNPDDVGTVVTPLQNPVQHRDRVIIPDGDGDSAAKVVTFASSTYTIADLPGSALEGRYATVFKDRVVLANSAAEPQRVAFSKPGDPTAAWDPISIFDSSLPITGIAALRSSVILFHKGSAERIRGTTPPDSTLSNQTGDMTMEWFPERVGLTDPKLIAGWRDNVIWGDERGIYMSDGSVTTSLTDTGGISRLWRSLWLASPTFQAGGVYGDYYIVCLYLDDDPDNFDNAHVGDKKKVTLVCNLSTRAWFAFSNISAICFIPTQGVGYESLLAGDQANRALIDMSTCFNPILDSSEARRDDNEIRVQPLVELGWSRLGAPGKKRAAMIYPGYMLSGVDGSSPLMRVELNTDLSSPESASWDELSKKPRTSAVYRRDRVPVRRFSDGFGFRFSIDGDIDFSDFGLYDLGFQGFAAEEMRAP